MHLHLKGGLLFNVILLPDNLDLSQCELPVKY